MKELTRRGGKIFTQCIVAVNACLNEYNESKKLDTEMSALKESIDEAEAVKKKLEFEHGVCTTPRVLFCNSQLVIQ